MSEPFTQDDFDKIVEGAKEYTPYEVPNPLSKEQMKEALDRLGVKYKEPKPEPLKPHVREFARRLTNKYRELLIAKGFKVK